MSQGVRELISSKKRNNIKNDIMDLKSKNKEPINTELLNQEVYS